MADRRADGTLRRAGARALLLGLAVAASAGCGSTPESDDGGVPLPPPAPLVTPGAPGSATAEPTSEGDTAPHTTASTEPAAASPEPGGPAASDDGGTPRWFPPVGTVLRMAGISPRDLRPLIEIRTVRAGGGPQRHEVDVEVAAEGDTADDVARETYLVAITDDEVRVSLAPDPLRRIPGPAREVPRSPLVGQTWSTPAGECRVEAVQQQVRTFTGTRRDCIRIRLTSPTGRQTLRWFDPDLGEVRREILDRDERVLAAWALCGPETPTVESCRDVLLTR